MRKALVFAAALALAAGPVRADTDYRCLNLCVQGGHDGSTCMAQCSSVMPLSTTKPNVNRHNVFVAPQPIDPDQIIKQDKPPKVNIHQDYQCVAKCLQTHMGYQVCTDGCQTVTTGSGSVMASPNKAMAISTAQPVPVATTGPSLPSY